MLQLFLFVIASAFSFPRVCGNPLERLAQGLHEIEQQASVTSSFGKPTKPTPKEVEQLTQRALDAIKNNNLDAVKQLVAAGADLTPQGKGGASAIDVALKHGGPDLVHFLLQKGAAKGFSISDIKQREHDFDLSRQGIINSEYYKISAHLDDYFKKMSLAQNKLLNALEACDIDAVQYSLKNFGFRQLLQDSAWSDVVSLVRYKNRKIEQDGVRIIEFLATTDPTPDIPDDQGNVALHHISELSTTDMLPLIKALVERAPLASNHKNKSGESPLDYLLFSRYARRPTTPDEIVKTISNIAPYFIESGATLNSLRKGYSQYSDSPYRSLIPLLSEAFNPTILADVVSKNPENMLDALDPKIVEFLKWYYAGGDVKNVPKGATLPGYTGLLLNFYGCNNTKILKALLRDVGDKDLTNMLSEQLLKKITLRGDVEKLEAVASSIITRMNPDAADAFLRHRAPVGKDLDSSQKVYITLLLKIYDAAKKYDLKKVGKYINDAMHRVKLMAKTPPETAGLIASYVA